MLAADSNNIKLLLKESLLIKRDKANAKQGDKIVSVRALWLRWEFYFYYYMIVSAFLIYSSDFNICTGRARICLSMSS